MQSIFSYLYEAIQANWIGKYKPEETQNMYLNIQKNT